MGEESGAPELKFLHVTLRNVAHAPPALNCQCVTECDVEEEAHAPSEATKTLILKRESETSSGVVSYAASLGIKLSSSHGEFHFTVSLPEHTIFSGRLHFEPLSRFFDVDFPEKQDIKGNDDKGTLEINIVGSQMNEPFCISKTGVCVLGRLMRAGRRKSHVTSMEVIPEFLEDSILCEGAWPLTESAEDWGMEYGDYGDQEESPSTSESEAFLEDANGDSVDDDDDDDEDDDDDYDVVDNLDPASLDEESTLSEWVKSSLRTGMTVGFGLAVGVGWGLVKNAKFAARTLLSTKPRSLARDSRHLTQALQIPTSISSFRR